MRSIAIVAALAAAALAGGPRDVLERTEFGDEVFRRVEADHKASLVRDLELLLQTAKVKKVRQARDRAVLVLEAAGVTYELPVAERDGRWVATAGRAYPVGKSLKEANGPKPAKLELTMRETNSAYGTSAFSFTHVTQDPKQCENRMDIRFCHNNEFHVRGRIADLGKRSPRKLTGLPLGANWIEGRSIPVVVGHTYVLHSTNQGRMDFFVKFRVVGNRNDKLRIEWALLTGGHNAPGSIHAPQPLVSNDGADGLDGLCGRRG